MNSLANQPSPEYDGLRRQASDLLDREVETIEAALGGRNNRVFRASCADGNSFAFKVYGPREDDPRDRMSAEIAGLRFLEHYNVSAVPRVIAEDARTGCAAFEWIDGGPVNPPSVMDVDAALRFVAELEALSGVDGTERLPLASAATLSGRAVARQIQTRLARFDELADETDASSELREFLDSDFVELSSHAVAWARQKYSASGIDFEGDLSIPRRVLSPSDFGFHNALRREDGRVVFVDFEYFGWDDPAKLVSDFLLHPGMTLSIPFRKRFHDGAMAVFSSRDGDFPTRLNALYPLYGLCWVLIMLNEFLPNVWARRLAAAGPLDAGRIRAAQLRKARHMLLLVSESLKDGPLFD